MIHTNAQKMRSIETIPTFNLHIQFIVFEKWHKTLPSHVFTQLSH